MKSGPSAVERLAFLGLVATYGVLATLYAVRTPPWQAPDEPAHFNYVRQLAANPLDLPRIEAGDWPQARLERLKASGFPAGESIAGIEYEDHQAPAWYYLASPVLAIARGTDEGRLQALRLLNVFLGAVGIWLIWHLVRSIWPGEPALAWGAAGFAAFLPMRLAVVSSASNDPLAEVVSTAAVWLAVARATGRMPHRRWTWGGGALLGLALLVKVSAYASAAILAAGEVVAWWRRGRFGTRMVALTILQIWALGLGIALPWFLRNARVYGAGDWMGRGAHDAVVVGQPTTAEWIARFGWLGQPEALLNRMAVWTFDSFWGVFGWMGVFLDQRVYVALAVVSALAVVGLLGYLRQLLRAEDAGVGSERAAVAILALSLATSVAGYLWWNLTFVQHQGRYLFPALAAIAVFFHLGLRQMARASATAAGRPHLARPAATAAALGFDFALAALAWLSLTRFIVPNLH